MNLLNRIMTFFNRSVVSESAKSEEKKEEPSKEYLYFDKEKQQIALKWLEEKWPKGKRKCICCGKKQWTLAEDLVMPLRFIGGQFEIYGSTYPHVLLVCTTCGHSLFFNAVKMGIVEDEYN